jgi:glycosyltransferase involved in cell wall biosynthesis
MRDFVPKIFVVSLHRCAAQSTELFLRNAGFKTCHWPAVVEGTDYQSKIVGSEAARAKIVRILRPVFDAFDAVSDVPVPALYKELDKYYPDAQFIAIYRNPFDWVRSVRRHCDGRPLDPYERVQYWRYLNTKPQRLEEITDDLLIRMYWQHYSGLSAHFNGRSNFVLVDLSDPEIGTRLSSFLNIPTEEFPRIDYKDSTTHRPENTVKALQYRLSGVEAELAQQQRQAADRIATLDATLQGALREYADLTRSMESAQRWLLGVLDSDMVSQVSAAPEDWPAHYDDAGAAHRAIIGRLIAAVDRANRLGLVFHERAASWHSERGGLKQQIRETGRALDGLKQQIRETRRALEKAIGERDRARTSQKMAEAGQGRPAAVATSGLAAPLVSIVLPVFNQAYLVEEAIAGVIAQTYGNWELIIVDDGSTDDLENRVRHYLDDRRVLFLRQPNQRLPAALNQGFLCARGDFLTWTSADNIMLPNQLERLVEELTAHPEAGLVYSDYWAIDDQGEPLDDPRWRSHNSDPEFPELIRLPSEVTIENFHRSRDNFIGASFLYRREVADIVGAYADDTFGGEDYDFWLRMHLATEFHHVAEPLYKYRVHADTLTSRAEDLGLFANIDELLEADRWRIDTLLTNGVLHSAGALQRPARQFHTAILKRCRPVAYGDLAESAPTALPDTPCVVDIDVPLRSIDAAALRHADILLCRSELTAALLRREAWAHGKRILCWSGELTPAVQHAFIQAFAERVTVPLTMPVSRTPARIDDPFQPSRILLLVERWLSGGLENVVVDLADSLAAIGRTVFIGAAEGAPPPAAGFAATRVRTLSFRGSESAFDAFLRREAIEVINYHHTRFGAGHATRQAIATVYTMHNCYLWMDDAARRAIAVGLAEMDRVIAVSRQVAQFAVAQFDVPVERIAVVPNGLSDAAARLESTAARPPIAGSSFTVAMVGSFSRLKLQHVAIAAFAAVAAVIPQMQLRLIGAMPDQAYAKELEAQIAASPFGHRIELVVGLTRAETIAALANAHVFLLPSLVEGCSMALLEAAAAGCVCIVTDVGSARDLATGGCPAVLLPSPLGELESVTQQQFFEAAAAELPEHRANIAEALRNVWRDYGSFAAAVAETRARFRESGGMQQMTDAYLLAYTMARRGPARRRIEPQDAAASEAIEGGVLAAASG